MANDSGTGTTLTFSGVTFDIRDIEWDGMEVPEVDLTHTASTVKTYTAGEIPDYGAFTVTALWDATHAIVAPGTSQTATIDPAGIGSTNTYTGTAFLQSMSVSIPMEDAMTCSMRFKWEGAVTKA